MPAGSHMKNTLLLASDNTQPNCPKKRKKKFFSQNSLAHITGKTTERHCGSRFLSKTKLCSPPGWLHPQAVLPLRTTKQCPSALELLLTISAAPRRRQILFSLWFKGKLLCDLLYLNWLYGLPSGWEHWWVTWSIFLVEQVCSLTSNYGQYWHLLLLWIYLFRSYLFPPVDGWATQVDGPLSRGHIMKSPTHKMQGTRGPRVIERKSHRNHWLGELTFRHKSLYHVVF